MPKILDKPIGASFWQSIAI